jgi:TRAP-type C4-dicarboxylate transport system substrate-binding protein
VQTVKDVCDDIRKQTKAQELEEINKAKANGVTFLRLPAADMATLKKLGDPVHYKYAKDINQLYPSDTYKPADYLKEVQEFLGYKK